MRNSIAILLLCFIHVFGFGICFFVSFFKSPNMYIWYPQPVWRLATLHLIISFTYFCLSFIIQLDPSVPDNQAAITSCVSLKLVRCVDLLIEQKTKIKIFIMEKVPNKCNHRVKIRKILASLGYASLVRLNVSCITFFSLSFQIFAKIFICF